MSLAHSYGVGDVIEYRPFGGGTRRVLVDLVEDDIKNGRPGFDGRVVGSNASVWGYDEQITRVLARRFAVVVDEPGSGPVVEGVLVD